jgi:hypothetical protein
MSEFIDMPTTGRELLSNRSGKTAERFGKSHGLDVYLLRGRKYFKRADVLAAIENSRIVAEVKPQLSSLKAMLEKISSEVLAKRRPS